MLEKIINVRGCVLQISGAVYVLEISRCIGLRLPMPIHLFFRCIGNFKPMHRLKIVDADTSVFPILNIGTSVTLVTPTLHW